MARIRQLKPEFFTSAPVCELPYEGRLLFQSMWCQADDDGRLPYDPTLLRSVTFLRDPQVTDADVAALIDTMLDKGLLTWLDVVQKKSRKRQRVLVVAGLREHQVINKPTPSKWMPVDLWEQYGKEQGWDDSSTGPLPDDSLPVRGSSKGTVIGTVTVITTSPDERFAEFYDAYPRKMKRGDAEKAWQQALRKGADPQVIIDGAVRLAADPNLPSGDERQFIPYPATWLRAEGWLDGPLPVRAGSRSRSSGWDTVK